jgi:hypothetical protein
VDFSILGCARCSSALPGCSSSQWWLGSWLFGRRTGPTVLRFNGKLSEADLPAVAKLGRGDVLLRPAPGTGEDVLLLGAGSMAAVCTAAAALIADQGIGVTVVDPAGHPGRRGDRRGGRAPLWCRGGRAWWRVRRRSGQDAPRRISTVRTFGLRRVPAARRAGPDLELWPDPAASGPRIPRRPAHPGTRARAGCLTVEHGDYDTIEVGRRFRVS